ncbi:hypothetical protein Tco_1341337, partial [Tanacetum coccineum]
MAPLPPREQSHPFLRYHGLEYSDRDISNFEERMLMEHSNDDGVVVFTSQAWVERFAAGRKIGALILGGQFVARLAEHFGLLTKERLQELMVTAPTLPKGDAGGVVEEGLRAPRGVDGVLSDELPQAVMDIMALDFFRFTTWTVTNLSQMMDMASVTYTRYYESPVEYQRHRELVAKKSTKLVKVSTNWNFTCVGVLKDLKTAIQHILAHVLTWKIYQAKYQGSLPF